LDLALFLAMFAAQTRGNGCEKGARQVYVACAYHSLG